MRLIYLRSALARGLAFPERCDFCAQLCDLSVLGGDDRIDALIQRLDGRHGDAVGVDRVNRPVTLAEAERCVEVLCHRPHVSDRLALSPVVPSGYGDRAHTL